MGKCSICQTEGHNKRTCPSQKTTDTDAHVDTPLADGAAPVAEKPVKEKKTKAKKENTAKTAGFEVTVTLTDGEDSMTVANLKYTKLSNMLKGIQSLKRRMDKISSVKDIITQLAAAEDGPKTLDDIAIALNEGGAGSSVHSGDYVFEVKAL